MPSLAFVAGDPSGDAHAAALIAALKRRTPGLSAWGLGGPRMAQAGLELLDDLTTAAAIGPFDASRHLSHLRAARRQFVDRLARQRPDAVVLTDFGDFNLPFIAPEASRLGCRVLYFISPQLWAWGAWRLRYVRKFVSRMIVFFPFERAFYERHGIPVTWVGHPLKDVPRPAVDRSALLERLGLSPWKLQVALLPGSRPSELARHVPVMLKSAERLAWHMPGLEFSLCLAPGLQEGDARRRAGVPVRVQRGALHETLAGMDAAIVASGTATLETALARVPMAVIYRTSWPTYAAARLVMRTPWIAMVNIVAGRPVVPELVQHQARPGRISKELLRILREPGRSEAMRDALAGVSDALGPPGAVERAAETVLRELNR